MGNTVFDLPHSGCKNSLHPALTIAAYCSAHAKSDLLYTTTFNSSATAQWEAKRSSAWRCSSACGARRSFVAATEAVDVTPAVRARLLGEGAGRALAHHRFGRVDVDQVVERPDARGGRRREAGALDGRSDPGRQLVERSRRQSQTGSAPGPFEKTHRSNSLPSSPGPRP